MNRPAPRSGIVGVGRGSAVGVAWLAVGIALSLVLAACGDGRPAYCDDLTRNAQLGTLTRALEARDLGRARRAATAFRGLADAAPADIRADMRALARAVADIVGLLEAEQSAGPNPADVERRREELNRRLGQLSATGSRIENWASRTCGITLSDP